MSETTSSTVKRKKNWLVGDAGVNIEESTNIGFIQGHLSLGQWSVAIKISLSLKHT